MSRCNRCQWRHDPEADQPSREQLADHARDSSHWLCACCGTSLTPEDQGTCETCLTTARTLLSGIVTMWTELPSQLGQLRGTAYDSNRGGSDGHPLPGGDALVLVGPGGTGQAGRRLTPHELRDGLVQGIDGREHIIDNRDTDPVSVAQALTSWEDDFRHTRGDEASPLVASSTARVLHAAAGYLEVHSRWAARNHPAFAEYFADLQDLHARLERATGRTRAAAKANASCFDCGGQLVRRVDDATGLEEDHVTCRRCRRQYTASEYALALRATVETGLQGWVPINEAAAKSRRSVETLESWAKRLVVNVACRLSDKRKVVWWPDIEQRATKAQKRKAS